MTRSSIRQSRVRSLLGGLAVLAVASLAAVPAWAAPGPADLSVTGPAAAIETAVNRTFTATFTVKNLGPGDANAASLTAAVPAGLVLTAATSTVGNCSTSPTLDCNLGKLDLNEVATVTATYRATKAGVRTITATVTTAATDPVATNNTDTARVNVAACTIVGTAGDDRLVGTSRGDVICGLAGNDTILGAGGDDVLRGGSGRDLVKGGPGADSVSGGNDADSLVGGLGKDRLFGNAGRDTLNSRDGMADRLYGGTGIDRGRIDRMLDTTSSVERRF